MKKKVISVLLCTTMVIVALTGCGLGSNKGGIESMSKDQLIQAYNNLVSENESIKHQLNTYASDGKEVKPSIDIMGDGSGKINFNSNDSKIIFPSSFLYPTSTSSSPDGSIAITQDVTIKPSSNWIVKLNGASAELQHTQQNTSATIKATTIEQQLTSDEIKTSVLEPWFANITNDSSSVVYSDIFMDGESYGMQAELPIMIDTENAYLVCGMAGVGSVAVTYVFVYRGEQDPDKTEAIKNVINSINITGSQLSVQN